MIQHKKTKWKKLLPCSLFFFLAAACPAGVQAAGEGSLLSVTEEAQILPISDGSEKYMLKSDGFYCLKADGTRSNTPEVHYFDHFVIDGTVFDGYYYHDESGVFRAGNPYVAELKQLTVPKSAEYAEDTKTEISVVFDGCYMVNNLGRLSAAPQVRYMDNLVLGGKTFNGFYYFNENGRLTTENGIHSLEMTSHGTSFDGSYYFGGADGVLVQEKGTTPEGFTVDKTGKVENLDEPGMKRLKPQLKTMLSGYEGEWSVYVKDLDQGKELVLNNKPLYSASLIKIFVMAETYESMDTVQENLAVRLKAAPDSDIAAKKAGSLLTNMITVSDNESYNELVRLQTAKYDFGAGARKINRYLKKEGYEDTEVLHTLAPSVTVPTGIGDNNMTSVKDCGLLLERIYNGECVNKEASEAMLELLLGQKKKTKIPGGLPGEIQTANKTGENDTEQHDIAIVYGEKTTYLLCIMSENCPKEAAAVKNIQDISRVVYAYLNA